MNAKWGWMTQVGLLAILLVAGCKTSQPDLKPPKQAEVFNPPSASVSPNYPKQAFNTDDPSKSLGLDPGGLTSTRGNNMTGSGINPTGSFGGPNR